MNEKLAYKILQTIQFSQIFQSQQVKSNNYSYYYLSRAKTQQSY
jgi:hypothetical protein